MRKIETEPFDNSRTSPSITVNIWSQSVYWNISLITFDYLWKLLNSLAFLKKINFICLENLSWKLSWNFTQKPLFVFNTDNLIWFDYQHWKIWKFYLNRNGFKKLVRIGVIGNWDDSRRIHILFWPPWWWWGKQESGSRCLDGRIGPETSRCCKLGQMLYNFFCQ